jgi:hypothetical protein
MDRSPVPIRDGASLRTGVDRGCRVERHQEFGVLEVAQERPRPSTMHQGRAGCGCMAVAAADVNDDSQDLAKEAFRLSKV